MIVSYRDKRISDFTSSKRIKAFSGFERAARLKLDRLEAAIGGQSVGGFMKTALANNQGELVIPALITGTFSKPKFEPDVQQMAQMRLKGLIPNITNPASVAGTLQNLLGGPKNPAEAPQQQAQQQPNTVQQILGLFGKKKPENQQPQQK